MPKIAAKHLFSPKQCHLSLMNTNCSPYELQRQENIARNRQLLTKLLLHKQEDNHFFKPGFKTTKKKLIATHKHVDHREKHRHSIAIPIRKSKRLTNTVKYYPETRKSKPKVPKKPKKKLIFEEPTPNEDCRDNKFQDEYVVCSDDDLEFLLRSKKNNECAVECPYIMFSGFNHIEVHKYSQQLEELFECNVLDVDESDVSKATHFVCDHPDIYCDKFLRALAQCYCVVTSKWIRCSIDRGRLLGEDEFFVKDNEVESLYGLTFKECMKRIENNHSILKNYLFFVHSTDHMSMLQLMEVIEGHEGKTTSSLSDFKEKCKENSTYAVVSEKYKKETPSGVSNLQQLPLDKRITTTQLVECILTQSIRPLGSGSNKATSGH